MVRINLSPWRPIIRIKKLIKFALAFIVAVVTPIVTIVVLGNNFIGIPIENQKVRNQLIKKTFMGVMITNSENQGKVDRQKTLLSQVNMIEKSVMGRQQAVLAINELVSSLLNSIVLSQITFNPIGLVIQGRVNTTKDLILLMDELRQATYFSSPNLDKLDTKTGVFTISLKQTVAQKKPLLPKK